MFFKKKDKKLEIKPQSIKRQDVLTTLHSNSMTADSNQDGIPDYLQREALPSLVKELKDTTLAHGDTQKELEKLKMAWRGYEYDPNRSLYVPVSPPMINERGIMEISSIIDPLINRHTMNSNFDIDWAHEQTKRISLRLAALIRDKRKIFGIGPSNRDMIIETVDALLFNVYSRGVHDLERTHTDKRLSLTGANNPQPQPGM